MHCLQSVLPWKSCESFAWFAGTASPHSAQRLKPSGGAVTVAAGASPSEVGGALGAGSGAVAGGLMHCATAAAACSSAEGGVAGTVSCFAAAFACRASYDAFVIFGAHGSFFGTGAGASCSTGRASSVWTSRETYARIRGAVTSSAEFATPMSCPIANAKISRASSGFAASPETVSASDSLLPTLTSADQETDLRRSFCRLLLRVPPLAEMLDAEHPVGVRLGLLPDLLRHRDPADLAAVGVAGGTSET
jgi:hypothetical protein